MGIKLKVLENKVMSYTNTNYIKYDNGLEIWYIEDNSTSNFGISRFRFPTDDGYLVKVLSSVKGSYMWYWYNNDDKLLKIENRDTGEVTQFKYNDSGKVSIISKDSKSIELSYDGLSMCAIEKCSYDANYKVVRYYYNGHLFKKEVAGYGTYFYAKVKGVNKSILFIAEEDYTDVEVKYDSFGRAVYADNFGEFVVLILISMVI